MRQNRGDKLLDAIGMRSHTPIAEAASVGRFAWASPAVQIRVRCDRRPLLSRGKPGESVAVSVGALCTDSGGDLATSKRSPGLWSGWGKAVRQRVGPPVGANSTLAHPRWSVLLRTGWPSVLSVAQRPHGEGRDRVEVSTIEIDPAVSAPSQPRSLTELSQDIQAAAAEVRTKRAAPVSEPDLLSARRVLLRAMEVYADELTARRLPIPRLLHDDLRLQRGLDRQPNAWAWPR